jgi:hypothetical protein
MRGGGGLPIKVGRPEGRGHLEDPGIGGRILLKWLFKKWDGEAIDWSDLVHRDRLL